MKRFDENVDIISGLQADSHTHAMLKFLEQE
jgi:hypothetical protein